MSLSDIEMDDEVRLTSSQEPVNIKKYLLKLLRRWPKIFLFFAFSLAIGFAVNRYLTPVYLVTARITTKKFSDKQSNMVPGLVDASFFLNGLIEVYEEIPILKSARRISAALNRVDLRVSYFSKGIVKTSALDRGYGFMVTLDSIVNDDYPHSVPIFVNPISEKKFELKINGNERWEKLVAGREFEFDKHVSLGAATLRISNTNGGNTQHNKYYFIINRHADLIAEYTNRLNIEWAMKGSAMLDLQILSELPERDLRFMNAYYTVVEEIGLLEKNETLDNTIKFIDEQMGQVSDSLNFYQSLANDIRLDNRKMPLGVEGIFTRLNELDQQKSTILLAERYFNYLIEYFRSNRSADVFAPSLIGLNVPLVERWVNQYIQEKLTAKRIVFSNEIVQNPLVNRSDSSGNRLELAIMEGIKSTRKFNQEKLHELDGQYALVYSSIADVQSGARELSQHDRLYQINNSLFDLFLRRRAEAAISKASATSDYKIINTPSYSGTPIKPDKANNLVIAAVLGFLFPVAFFFLRDITSSYIMDRDDLQANLHIPLLGSVAHSNYETNLVLKEHPRSVVAESFRAIRANLKFLAAGVKTRSNTFILTSTIGGEGKTFSSINLTYTLALSGKKTIMIGADMRKPELENYLGIQKANGLSEYLAGYCDVNKLIVEGGDGQPDFILPGKVPPNPAELLSNIRMTDLIVWLKERYDYIIIDTPPIGLVSDAMELFKYSDYNILIVRQGVTPKAALRMIDELYLDGRLKNFTALFNDIEVIKRRGSYYGGYLYGMGYSGYGFGYYEEDKDKNGKVKS